MKSFMKVVILGSTGQLAHDLLGAFGRQAVGLNHQDVDITDGVGVVAALEELRPDWVLNTAAFSRVDDCEINPRLAFEVNALGAHNVARAAAAVKAGVVFFSTDYVFSGLKRGPGQPYDEDDAPRPLGIYGVSKWTGEQLVMQGNPRHLVIRTTGLYGTSTSRKGWTFPELMLQKGKMEGKARVVTDQVLSPTFTEDLAGKVKELIERQAAGLFHLTNSGECSWFDFARTVFELAAVKVEMEPITTVQSQRRAVRPSYSAMRSVRLANLGIAPMRPWQEALKDYLIKKGFCPAPATNRPGI
jgi:dTDP-4-dehydrorhamnose reductase